jgi:hypothetical protein
VGNFSGHAIALEGKYAEMQLLDEEADHTVTEPIELTDEVLALADADDARISDQVRQLTQIIAMFRATRRIQLYYCIALVAEKRVILNSAGHSCSSTVVLRMTRTEARFRR